VSRYRFDQFAFDSADGRLEHAPGGAALTLRPQVARLLVALLESPRSVIDRESLCRAIWGDHAVVDFEAGLAAVVRELRQALEQLGGRADLLETVPRRGFRLLADVHPDNGQEGPDGQDPVPARTTRLNRQRWAKSAALAAVMALIWLLAWWTGPPRDADEPPEWTLAVLPFERLDAGAAPGARLELLLADALLVQLWQAELEGVVLIGRATLLPYQAREDVAGAVARDLGVRLLIEGSIARDGDTGGWVVTARLLDMPAGRVLWSDTIAWREAGELQVRESAQHLVENLAQAWPGAAIN
jgi:DNA-binding winged helix-turn-helix (wHTH) protein/TolB-like protein